jgi:AcrR family transcriptional regulator
MPAEARSRLLDLALEEFAERGFQEASLNEILSKVGISKGAYYYYFDDKEDLFATAIESAQDAMLLHLQLPAFEDMTPEGFWPAVERTVRQWAATFDSSSDLIRASLSVTEVRRRSPRFAAVLEKAHAVWKTVIEAGQRLRCVRTDIPNDHLIRLMEAVDLVLDTNFLGQHSKPSQAALEEHIGLVFDTFKRLIAVETLSSRERPTKRKRRRRG